MQRWDDRRMIVVDYQLRKIIPEQQVHMLQIQKYLNHHYVKRRDED